MFLTLTNSFKMFDQNLALTGGAPGKSTQMLEWFLKDIIAGIIVAIIAFIQLRATRSKEVEQ